MHTIMRPSRRLGLVTVALGCSLACLFVTGCKGSETGSGGAGGAPTTTSSTASPSSSTGTTAATTSTTMQSGATGTGGAGGAPFDCSTLPLCDDFESAAANGPPNPAKWSVVQPSCGGGPATVTIDDTVAHSGHNSVRVDGAIDYCDHKYFADLNVIGTLGPEVYGRFFVRFADPLGQNHSTFLSMTDANAAGKNLRMGGQGKIFMYNRETDDAVLPSNFSNSVEPSKLTWYCVEFRINGPQGEIETWIDGTDEPGLRVDGTATQGIDDAWHQGPSWHPSLTDFRLGWESYSNQAMTLWFDDVALSTSRIGCN